MLERQLHIATPENVTFGYPLAGIGSRFLAALLDVIVMGCVQMLIGMGLLFLVWWVSTQTPLQQYVNTDDVLTWAVGLFGLLNFAVLWGYYILFEVFGNGQTPGKHLLGLRVICLDGAPVTLTESLIRNLLRLVDALPFFYGVGLVTMFLDGKGRRLGDLAAGTVVVRQPSALTINELLKPPAPPAWHKAFNPDYRAEAWPVERLTPEDLALAEDFLRRQPKLAYPYGLGRLLWEKLCARMQVDNRSVYPPEHLIAAVARQARNKANEAEVHTKAQSPQSF